MAVGFAIRVDLRQVELALSTVKNGVPRVTVRAINRTLTTVRTSAGRSIAADIGVPVRTVTPSLIITKARFSTLAGRIHVDDRRRIPLIDLRATGPEPSRGRGQGVSYSLGGRRRRIATAFIARMKSGHRGVFRRVTKARLPIVELKGPSIARVAGQRRILEALKALGQRTLVQNMHHEVRFLLRDRVVPPSDGAAGADLLAD